MAVNKISYRCKTYKGIKFINQGTLVFKFSRGSSPFLSAEGAGLLPPLHKAADSAPATLQFPPATFFQFENPEAPPPPPIPVFADIECYQDEDRVFHANLICWSSAEEDEIHHSDKIEDFWAALEGLTEVEGDERERKVVSFFHNMRVFDGNFILEKLYDQ